MDSSSWVWRFVPVISALGGERASTLEAETGCLRGKLAS